MTRHRSIHTLLGTVFATAALVALVAPPASARIVEKESFHDEFSGTIEDFCGAGISVDFAGDRRRAVPGQLARARRAGLLPREDHRRQRLHGPQRDDGDRHPAQHHQQGPVAGRRPRRWHAHDRGAADGGERTYGNDGKLIASNSGQVRFEIVYDYVNDVELSSELVFGSTGTNDDFCEAVLTDWGYL